MKKNIAILLSLLCSHTCNGMITTQITKTIRNKKNLQTVFLPYQSKKYSSEKHKPDLQETFNTVCAEVLGNPYMSTTDKITLLKNQIDKTDLIDYEDKQALLYKKGFAALHAMFTKHPSHIYQPLLEGEQTVFHIAAQENNLPLLQVALKVLPHYENSFDRYNKENNTAIYIGAKQLNYSIVKSLCNHGANANSINENGRTPLTAVILSPDAIHPELFNTTRDLIKCLHEYGADEKIQDIHKRSALDYIEEGLHDAHFYERRTIRSELAPLIANYETLKEILTSKE